MRKTVGMLVAIVMLFAWFPASSRAAVSEDFKRWAAHVKAKLGGTTIVVSGIPHPSTEAFQAMTPEFTELTGIKVEWDLIETGRIQSKQFLEHSARTGRYDVYMYRGVAVVEYAAREILVPLKPYLDGEFTPKGYDYADVLPAGREALGTAQGIIVGIPTAPESFFLGYRKDLFQKYGKQPPNTTEELLELARFFKNREPRLAGIVMRALTGRSLGLVWTLFTHQFGGRLVDQRTWTVTTDKPETIRSLAYLVDLLKAGPTGIENYTWEEATSAFMAGRAAMWFEATALQPWLEDPKRSAIVGKVGYAPPPRGPHGRFGAIAGWAMGMPVHSSKKDAAWAFIAYMTSKEMAPTYVAKGGVVNRNSTLNDPKYVATHPEFVRALRASYAAAANIAALRETWVPPTDVAGQIWERAGFYAGQALLGKMTPEEAGRAAAKELKAILDRATVKG